MLDIKGKKVLVVGLGKSGLAAALFLRRCGAKVTVSDMRSAEQLAKEIPALLEAGIMVETGGHGLLTFRRQDLIVVSPGVPMDTPELAQVKSFGLPVIGELELAAHYLKGKMLAVTGSNGKTTTTTLLGEILEAGGLPTLVGGNIGVPVISLIESSTDASWSVLEISSFQLETTFEFHPSITSIAMAALITTFASRSASLPPRPNRTAWCSMLATLPASPPPSVRPPRSIGFPTSIRSSRAHGSRMSRWSTDRKRMRPRKR
jgi:UDP-N-acetylmuramoylalanine--D-glutamate ligase